MLTIVYSERAIKQAETIKRYLLYKFTQREVDHFYELLTLFEDRVISFPELYRKSGGNKKLHRAVLSKQLSVFYKHSKSKITVMAVLDNRMSPKKWP
jgi:plasmid stabilization system protein ParE